MQRCLRAIVISIATIAAMMVSAYAMPVVQTGSSYSIYLEGSESGNPSAGIFIFDGIPETILRTDGQTLTVSENETDLSATRNQINITLRGDGDLFPMLNETAILGIGTFGFNLDLLFPVRLDEARIFFLTAEGVQIAMSDNLASQVNQQAPWDGFFPDDINLFGIGGVGGQGVTTVSFQFLVTAVQADLPEPGTVMLSLIGLLAVAAGRRCRSRVAGA